MSVSNLCVVQGKVLCSIPSLFIQIRVALLIQFLISINGWYYSDIEKFNAVEAIRIINIPSD